MRDYKSDDTFFGIFWRIILLIVGFVAVVGFMGPTMISSSDDNDVIIGIIVCVLSIPYFWFIGKGLFEKIKEIG